jgi:hypothetical protein
MTLNVNYGVDLEVRSERTQIDRAFFNRRFKILYDELARLDVEVDSFGAAEATLIQLGLDRINETLGPALTTLNEAAALGFLTCRAIGANHSMVPGEFVGWDITEGADLFTPTHWLLALDETDFSNWGILSVDPDGWHATTGDLATHVVYSSKVKTSSQWQIAAHAGVLPAMQDLVGQATTAKNDTLAAKAEVQGAITALNALLGSNQTVLSVAGRQGAVVLGTVDIGGLDSALASKATITYVNSSVAGKQTSSAKLDTLANMTWANNKIIYATSGSALGTLDITDYAKTLLDDADASTHLSTLGISAFIKTLLDDADAATARTTLGVVGTVVPVKASLVETLAGTDDAKFLTPADGAAFARRSLDRVTQAANFTLDAGSNGKTIVWTKTTAGSITLSPSAAADTECLIIQEAAGQITFAAGAGGTMASRGSRFKSAGQYAFVTAVVMSNSSGANAAWRLGGDLVT